MSHSVRLPLVLALAIALPSCSSDDSHGAAPAPEAGEARDAQPDGLFRDFLDGKYDSAGHPLDAQVWQAEDGCDATSGSVEAKGRAFRPGHDAAGFACRAGSSTIGLGRFSANVRALALSACSGEACDAPALTLTAKETNGTVIDSKTFTAGAFGAPLRYQNLALTFSHSNPGAVRLELTWSGKTALRIDYVELFRSSRNVLVTPPSGIYDPSASFVVEVQDPPSGFTLRADCNGTDLSDTVASLLASGTGTREDTEFRSTFSLPAAALTAACTLPARVRFQVAMDSWVQATSRVSLYPEAAPCSFTSGTTRVLLTGFEPFPADSNHDNSSEQAVATFDPAAVPGISLMTLTLPVEFDSAPAIVESAIERCAPDVIVGFGQGRSQVDLETTAYNLKDSSEIAGGVPDNRGLIPGGVPIDPEGPAERETGLPALALVEKLSQAGISSGTSDDPGRYVCNDVFYTILRASAGTSRVGGFVHLPYIYTVDDADRAMLKTVVTEVVTQSVAKQQGK